MRRARIRQAFGGTSAGILMGLCALSGCRKGEEAAPAPRQEELEVTLGPENVARAEVRQLRSGPGISGNLQARTAAAVRAEVGGTILDIKAQQGQVVKKGEELARIEDVTLKDQLIAAAAAVRTARSALQVAEAEQERATRLSKAGVITQRDFERAELSVEQAKGQLAEARSRHALAQEQLNRARVVAPLAGAVSERQASAGDVVQPGAPLFTVVDPRTLRLEASVPAAQLEQVQVDTPVEFRVTGYGDRAFRGTVERINPVVDPATGQVRIYVAIPNTDLQLLAGLFAEGRVVSKGTQAVAIPIDAIDDTGTEPSVLRIQEGRVQRVNVTLGLRDEVARQVEVRSGLEDGDVVLLGAARSEVAEGGRVKVSSPRPDSKPVEEAGPGVGGSEAPPQPSSGARQPTPRPASTQSPAEDAAPSH